MVKTTVRDFKKFLKQRALTRSFNQWNKIKKVKKTVIPVAYSNYDGTSRRSKVYVFRQGNRTVFRDFNTLKVIGSSKRSKAAAIKDLNSIKKEKKGFNVRGWSVSYNERNNGLKLKNANVTYSYNQAKQRLRSVTKTNSVKRNKVGRVICDLTYISKSGIKVRVQFASPIDDIYKSSVRKNRIEWCISNGSREAGFSPIDVIINAVWYEYWEDRNEKLKKIS